MDIRQAILKAAEQFDRAPHLFNYWKIKTPECGSPGCAIGWAATFREMTGYVHEICQKALGVSDTTFYNRMRDLDYVVSACNAAEMATGLRLYADKYHPAPIVLPDWNALASEPLPVAERTVQV